ncbi:MAG: VWA domain-containing protein [Gemmatimonadota bacterium]
MIGLNAAGWAIAASMFVLLFCAAVAAWVRRRRRVARALGDADLIRRLLPVDLAALPWRRLGWLGFAAATLTLAMLDPALTRSVPLRGGPVVLLLDASGSMLVEDVGAARLDVQREVATDLVARLPDVPIGVVAFSGRAYSLTPPTRDAGAIRMYLSAVDPTIVSQTGSALGAAIRQGIGLLQAEEGAAPGSIVLIGDGDETEDREAALAAAELARRSGLRLHAAAVGTTSGGPVPALDLTTGTVQGFLRDPSGELVLSRVDEDLLRTITRRGGGIYVPAGQEAAVDRLAEALRGGEPRPTGAPADVPLHVWLLGAAFFLLLLEPLATVERRPR